MCSIVQSLWSLIFVARQTLNQAAQPAAPLRQALDVDFVGQALRLPGADVVALQCARISICEFEYAAEDSGRYNF